MHLIAKASLWISAHRGRVLGAWVLLLVVAIASSRIVGSQFRNDNSLPGTGSQRTADVLRRDFRVQAGDSDQIVFRVSSGRLAEPGVRVRIESMLRALRALPHVSAVVSPFDRTAGRALSADGKTGFATVLFDQRANDLPTAAVERAIATAERTRSRSLEVEFGGQAIERVEQPSLGQSTLVGLGAAVFVLMLAFGSLLAAGLPIASALLGLGSGFGVIALVSRVVSMPNVSTELAAMIGLGVGIDYALFVVNRFRHEYRAGGDLTAAIAAAMDTAGRAVVFAGLTVIIALLGMLALGVSFLSGMAVATAIAVALTVLAAITVLPALLARFGARIGRSRRGGGHERERLWRRWTELVERHPWAATFAGVSIMLVLAAPALSLRLGVSDAGSDPSGQTTRKAYDLLSAGFGKGYNGPLEIVAQLPTRNDQAALDAIGAALARTPDVASTSEARISGNGRTAVWRLYPRSAPQASATTQLVNHLRHDVLPPLEARTSTSIFVGGVTATGVDFTHVLAGKLPLFIAIVLALAALLLLFVFRSLLIPLQAILLNLLSIAAALGATVAVFQHGWLAGAVGIQPGPIEPWLPVMVFAIVFGLSMDYEVFLISRIHEQWTRLRDPDLAIREGLATTGRVITAAAAIMVCVFLAFAAGPERAVKLFGLSLAAGVFLDAFVVRILLLPATLHLLGERAWRLPTRLDKHLPRLAIDPPTTTPALEEVG